MILRVDFDRNIKYEKKWFFIYPYLIVLLATTLMCEQTWVQRIPIASNISDLSGKWGFRIDSPDVGIKEQWLERRLSDEVVLPGSMTTNGKGKFLVSGIDLLSDKENRLEARQLLYNLKKHMASDKFKPKEEVSIQTIKSLFTDNK